MYQSVRKPSSLPPPPLTGEFDPKRGPPSPAFDFCVKILDCFPHSAVHHIHGSLLLYSLLCWSIWESVKCGGRGWATWAVLKLTGTIWTPYLMRVWSNITLMQWVSRCKNLFKSISVVKNVWIGLKIFYCS